MASRGQRSSAPYMTASRPYPAFNQREERCEHNPGPMGGLPCPSPACPRGTDQRSFELRQPGQVTGIYRRAKRDDGMWEWRLVGTI